MSDVRVGDKALTEEAAVARIRALVAGDAVVQARALSRELARLHPDWPRVAEYASVLAPPAARPTGRATGRDTSAEIGWLRRHGRDYAGQWVALRGAELLGASPDRLALHDHLADRGQLQEVLFAFIPRDRECTGGSSR